MPTIRSCRPDEADKVLALWREAGSVPGATDTTDAIGRLIETSRDALLVAELDGELVGSLIAAWDGWRGNLYRLAVVPSHRGAGIARALLADGERRLRAKGAVRISVLVVGGSEAPEFWHAVGYEHDDRVLRFVRTLGR